MEKRIRFTIILVLILIVVIAFSFQSKEKKEYQAILKNIDNSDYVEQEARDKLKMIMPGETLYVLPESTDNNK